MERKPRKKEKSSKKRVSVEDSKVPFLKFFNDKVKEKKLNFWQEKEIWVFFEQQGLSKLEDLKKYEEMLKLY